MAAEKDLLERLCDPGEIAQLQGALVRMEGRAQEEHQAKYAVAEQMAAIQQERNSAQNSARHWQQQYHAALAVVISAHWLTSIAEGEELPDSVRDAITRLEGILEIFNNRHATDTK